METQFGFTVSFCTILSNNKYSSSLCSLKAAAHTSLVGLTSSERNRSTYNHERWLCCVFPHVPAALLLTEARPYTLPCCLESSKTWLKINAVLIQTNNTV